MEEANEIATKRRRSSQAYQSNERLTVSAETKPKLSLTIDGSNSSSRRNSFNNRKASDESTNQKPQPQNTSGGSTKTEESNESQSNVIHKEISPVSQTNQQSVAKQEQEEEERDLKKEIIDAQRIISVYRHETTPSSLDFADDYTESTASSASSLDSLEKFITTVKTMANVNDSDELETYHPRMESNAIPYQPTILTMRNDQINQNQKSEFHEIEQIQSNDSIPASTLILQQPESSLNSHDSVRELTRALSPYRQPDSDQSTVELNKPHPLPDPDFVPKPILKRPVSPDPLTSSQSNHQLAPEKEKSNKSERKGGIMQFFTSKKSSSNNSLTSSQDKLKTEKQQSSETLTKSQQARNAMIERRQSSIEENKVMIDHYSDIVKEVGSLHKSPKPSIYLSNSAASINDDEKDYDRPDNSTATSKLEQKPINKLSTIASNESTSKTNESYSRSIFAIKLSKDPKKLPTIDNEKGKFLTETSNEKDTMSSQTPNKELLENSSEATSKKIEKIRSRPKETTPSNASKRKTSKTRDRSNSAVRSTAKSQTTKEKEKNIEQGIEEKSTAIRSQNKRLRSESKSPSTKNRRALLGPSKSVLFQSLTADKEECRTPSPRCQTPEEFLDETQTKVKSTMNYITDVAIFCVACWVYLFKDARLALPIVALMIYRQLIAILKEKCPKWIKWKRD